jgi:hypothetical protein
LIDILGFDGFVSRMFVLEPRSRAVSAELQTSGHEQAITTMHSYPMPVKPQLHAIPIPQHPASSPFSPPRRGIEPMVSLLQEIPDLDPDLHGKSQFRTHHPAMILGRGSTFPLRFAAWRNERKVSPASSEMRMRCNTPFREGLPISRVQFLPWSSFKPSHRMRSAIASTFQMWWGDKMKFTLSDVSKSIDREPTTQNSSPPSPTHATNPRVRFSGNKSA